MIDAIVQNTIQYSFDTYCFNVLEFFTGAIFQTINYVFQVFHSYNYYLVTLKQLLYELLSHEFII